ncbi:hypothetical protein D7X94_07555 [Acutalibacter sp. 1XD8-33]|uniref:hypothetical protein n=1 Tax=Acutalibacter sp. 1XD8-33 TaxID=2320081 RepID=UPI000EA3CCAE|nr:hypothetical protein [Acutalibacter sp. 1XD8-33]RKJ40573.1 hypothetical protein D7X94_07555 [Acutalibacter sp. 1XD8-33]
MKKTALFFALCLLVILAGCGGKKGAAESGEAGSQSLYTTVVQYSGEDESTEKYLEIAGRSQKLLPLLEKNLDAFVMDAYNFQDADGEGTLLYTLNGMNYPEEIDPNGCSVRIDPNYLKVNPIESADGRPIEEQLVMDDCTLNLLVPEKFREQEADILEGYRKHFYFEKVEAENSYNQEAGIQERLDLSLEDLSVHIIYVKNGQEYCTFRKDCAADTGNRISDPVAQIYTGNIHCNYAHSLLSQWTYFYWDGNASQAFEAMKPYVKQCGASESFRAVDLAGEF